MIDNVSSNTKRKVRHGMGFIPIFNDFSVYRGIKMFAGQRKMKLQSLVVEIVQAHYQGLMGSTLNVSNAETFHKQVSEACKKQKTRDVPDFIEYACSKYLEKMIEQMKPAIRRG